LQSNRRGRHGSVGATVARRFRARFSVGGFAFEFALVLPLFALDLS
jgi:Flp pilus assembly protein TadG